MAYEFGRTEDQGGNAEFFLTGIVVDLLNLRPEICTVIYIKDEEWRTRWTAPDKPLGERIVFNAEYESRSGRDVKNVPVQRFPVEDPTSLLEHYRPHLAPYRIVPSGAAGLWLGLDVMLIMSRA